MSLKKLGLKISTMTFLEDNQEKKRINSYISSPQKSQSVFEKGGKHFKFKIDPSTRPKIDKARMDDIKRVERRYNMNFLQKKKPLYSTEYLMGLSRLLYKPSKDYIEKRTELIEKCKPIKWEAFIRSKERRSQIFLHKKVPSGSQYSNLKRTGIYMTDQNADEETRFSDTQSEFRITCPKIPSQTISKFNTSLSNFQRNTEEEVLYYSKLNRCLYPSKKPYFKLFKYRNQAETLTV